MSPPPDGDDRNLAELLDDYALGVAALGGTPPDHPGRSRAIEAQLGHVAGLIQARVGAGSAILAGRKLYVVGPAHAGPCLVALDPDADIVDLDARTRAALDDLDIGLAPPLPLGGSAEQVA